MNKEETPCSIDGISIDDNCCISTRMYNVVTTENYMKFKKYLDSMLESLGQCVKSGDKTNIFMNGSACCNIYIKDFDRISFV